MSARNLSELPPTAWSKNTHYVIDMEPLPFRVRAEVAGETVLDCTAVFVMYELGHAPVYYVPKGDLSQALLSANDHSTYCPYKGDARYWDLRVGERLVENAVWAYDDPYDELPQIRDHMAFYADRVDEILIDGDPQPSVGPGWTDR